MPARTYDSESDDPLSRVLAPPRNEKPAAREARLMAEREAKKRSDLIDQDIDRQRAEDRKGMRTVKILLLGTHNMSPYVMFHFLIFFQKKKL
jgi:guanine nucleotide-binding protein alpha-1 subunit